MTECQHRQANVIKETIYYISQEKEIHHAMLGHMGNASFWSGGRHRSKVKTWSFHRKDRVDRVNSLRLNKLQEALGYGDHLSLPGTWPWNDMGQGKYCLGI